MRRQFPQALLALAFAVSKFARNLSVFVLSGIVCLSLSGLARAATSGTAWPGQAGNPVGYSAYGPLGTTPWPGGSFQSGTAGNPTIYQGYVFNGSQTISGSYIEFISCDFNSRTGGVLVSGDHIAFIGDRFQSNSVANYNVQTTGTNLVFLYDSFTPLASLYTAQPGLNWPSAAAGQNTTTQTVGVNAIDGNSGYQYGLNIWSGGPVTVDHSDFWGFGNGGPLNYSTTAQMIITSNWIHDAANASPQSYHQDGIGYVNGVAGPSNVTAIGNTIASLGNANAVAFQAATSGYNNMLIVGNYLSGFGYTMAPGAPGNTHFANSAVFGNVFGTDVQPIFGPLYGWTAGSNSVWACNTLAFRAGTTWTDGNGWTPSLSINGQFWVPGGGATNSSTDYNGNTICPSLAPGSLAWKGETVKTTSSGQNVTLLNAGSGTLTIGSISLQTGTQFAISSDTCGTSLAPGAACVITVTFTPISLGPQIDALQISDNSPAPSSPQSVPLVGFGTGTAPNLPAPPTGLSAQVS